MWGGDFFTIELVDHAGPNKKNRSSLKENRLTITLILQPTEHDLPNDHTYTTRLTQPSYFLYSLKHTIYPTTTLTEHDLPNDRIFLQPTEHDLPNYHTYGTRFTQLSHFL